MNFLDRIFDQPELRDDPPVLVDVGAAGGVHRAWRKIARYSIGVGFEPDARDAAPLNAAQRQFRKWVFCPTLVVPTAPPGDEATLHLTKSPQCSSTLRPRASALREWAFADFFDVNETRLLPAATLVDALSRQGIEHVDWMKCDTQGTDLRIFLSLPPEWRARQMVIEFEPGLIDAYEGEDKAADVLTTMAQEPFWLAQMRVGETLRGRSALLEPRLGHRTVQWVRRASQGAPGWVNLQFLRDFAVEPKVLDCRAHLLGWVCATIVGQHGQALTVAEEGEERFGGDLFGAMATASERSLRLATLHGLPRWAWRRLWRE